ncbi:hypothetical protein M9H77_07965 [Catharanthus roseus]|uniref:Uncharacterized protein n=1 Tax=Catharanthus roseus TaxID=4058 RepID=A0ACC0BWG4_CATRO|nr:hypothetical protein M9H77_07965 [Catharanthus roseus]
MLNGDNEKDLPPTVGALAIKELKTKPYCRRLLPLGLRRIKDEELKAFKRQARARFGIGIRPPKSFLSFSFPFPCRFSLLENPTERSLGRSYSMFIVQLFATGSTITPTTNLEDLVSKYIDSANIMKSMEAI